MRDGIRVSESTRLEVERFSIELDDEAEIQKFRQDPEGYLHEVISELGQFEINSIRFAGKPGETEFRATKIDCYHVVYPPEEASNTICL